MNEIFQMFRRLPQERRREAHRQHRRAAVRPQRRIQECGRRGRRAVCDARAARRPDHDGVGRGGARDLLPQEADARQAEAVGGEPAEVHAVQDHREGRRAAGNKRIGKR